MSKANAFASTRNELETHVSRARQHPFEVALVVLVGALVVSWGCSGKKRDFASGVPGTTGAVGAEVPDAASSLPVLPEPPPSAQSGSSSELPPVTTNPAAVDVESQLPAASPPGCEDACSGECTPGTVRCANATERVECEIDARWGDLIPCPNICAEGACTGECSPGATECVTSTRIRTCSEQGLWSEPANCAAACVGTSCSGECVPAQTRCASATAVEVCGTDGVWGEPTACQNACVGGACTGECVPGATRCASETVLQTCNDQGQFLTGTACPFACVDGACSGECSPGSRRCSPVNGVPQFCGGDGIWESQAPCQFTCTNTGTCAGECTPGTRRCDPLSGQPQVCTALFAWQSQGACAGACDDGLCVVPPPGLGQACPTGQCAQGACSQQGICCVAGCATGCRVDGSCDCPVGSAFRAGVCDCNPGRSLCSDGITSACVANVFDFEDGTLQGWFASTVAAPAPCGDGFSQCLQTLNVNDTAGFAHGGTFFASANGTVLADGVRRLSAQVQLCGIGAATTSLVGQRVSAFMRTGSQGGSPAGTTFSLSLQGPTGSPVTLITVSAATIGGAQTTDWTELSAIVPDSATAREALNVLLSLEIPGTVQRSQSFQIDDVRIGE